MTRQGIVLVSIKVSSSTLIGGRPLKPVSAGYGYSVDITSTDSESVTIGPGATRGLAVHPVGMSLFSAEAVSQTDAFPLAAGVTFIALLFSLSSHVTLSLLASLLSFVAALLTLIAFAIDITLYIIVHNRVQRLQYGLARTVAAPGMAKTAFPFSSLGIVDTWATGVWITLVSLIMLLMAACTGWFGRRRSRMAGATDYLPPEKPGVFAMFRRS